MATGKCSPVMAINVCFQNGGRPPSWILPEVKFDVTVSCSRPVSIALPNMDKISQRVAELWRFTCFQNGGRRHFKFTSGVDFCPFWIVVRDVVNNNTPISVKLDTGAECCVMTLKTYNTIPARPKIVPTDVLIRAYGMHSLIEPLAKRSSTSHSEAAT